MRNNLKALWWSTQKNGLNVCSETGCFLPCFSHTYGFAAPGTTSKLLSRFLLCIGKRRSRVQVTGQIIRSMLACIKIKVRYASALCLSLTLQKRQWELGHQQPALTSESTQTLRALPSFLFAGETGTSSNRVTDRDAGVELLAVDLDRDLLVLLCSGRCLRDAGLWEGCMMSDFLSKSAIPFSSSGTAVEKHTRLKGNAKRTAEHWPPLYNKQKIRKLGWAALSWRAIQTNQYSKSWPKTKKEHKKSRRQLLCFLNTRCPSPALLYRD